MLIMRYRNSALQCGLHKWGSRPQLIAGWHMVNIRRYGIHMLSIGTATLHAILVRQKPSRASRAHCHQRLATHWLSHFYWREY